MNRMTDVRNMPMAALINFSLPSSIDFFEPIAINTIAVAIVSNIRHITIALANANALPPADIAFSCMPENVLSESPCDIQFEIL